jgi:hypothetical protein
LTERADLLIEGAERPAASRKVALLILGAALLASIAIPDVPVGLSITLVAFAVAIAVVASRPVELDRVALLYGGSALVLASVPILRAAEWVVAVDLAAAAVLGALAVTRATSWQEVFRSPLAVMGRLTRAPGFIAPALVPRPGFARRLGPALRGAGLGAVLLLVFGTLFATADRAFASLASDLLIPDDVRLDLVAARILVFGATLVGTGALILAGRRYALATGGEATAPAEHPRGLGRGEWLTPLVLLDLLFLGFVAVQMAVLFGGHRYVLDTEGVTYAEYARQGFFQLVAVGALTLAVVAGAVRWARVETRGDSVLLRLLLGALSLLTLVVLASALRRLNLYEDAFGLTRLRLSVHATILWMAGIFVLVLVAGAMTRTSWLPRAAVTLTGLSLVAFTLVNPEGLVAERNVERFEATGSLDLGYIRTLGVDAVPALLELPPAVRCWALEVTAMRLTPSDSILGWNLPRNRARALLGGAVGEDAFVCPMGPLRRYPGVRLGL